MKRLTVLAVGLDLPKDEVHVLRGDSTASLLDADVLLYSPNAVMHVLHDTQYHTISTGRKIIDGDNWRRARNQLVRWSEEVSQLLAAGKVVVCFLQQPQSIYATRHSASGELLLESQTGYDVFTSPPTRSARDLTAAEGKELLPGIHPHFALPYFRALKDTLSYQVYLKDIAVRGEHPFLYTKTGQVVALSRQEGPGTLLFLPPPDFVASETALAVLVQIARVRMAHYDTTPPPGWAGGFAVPGEREAEEAVNAARAAAEAAQEKLAAATKHLESVQTLRGLLFETGNALEVLAQRAFELLGFAATPFRANDLEHDLILTADEGRALVEIEGKDKDAVHIDKLDQLSRVVDEDFNLHGSYSEGILLCNAHRFMEPSVRPPPFTDKVLAAAARKRFILLTTSELFLAVRRVLLEPTNVDLKREYRRAIFASVGTVAALPRPRD
jgi:hypothetical protein